MKKEKCSIDITRCNYNWWQCVWAIIICRMEMGRHCTQVQHSKSKIVCS